MPDSEAIDRLLRRSLSTETAPTLSPEFKRRLANRLRPRRMNPRSRYFLLGYTLLGVGLSLGAMLASGMDWRLAGVSVLAPLVVTGGIIRPFFRSPNVRRLK